MIIFLLLFNQTGQSQSIFDIRLSINAREEKINDLIKEISKKTNTTFSYTNDLFNENQRFTINKKDATLNEVLDYLLTGTSVTYDEFKGQIILFLVKPNDNGRYEVSGTLIDSVSNARIYQAHVYFNDTDIGSYSDLNGEFILDDIAEGVYELVISHVTYGISNYFIKITKNLDGLEFVLAPRTNHLDEVTIVSEKDSVHKLEEYAKFKFELLGVSNNADECVINNPEDIRIDEQAEDFEVYARKPISITNHGLGYEILYDLIFFESNGDEIFFIGKTNFSKMRASSRKEARKWKKNRLKAYNGSVEDYIFNTSKKGRSKFSESIVDEIPYYLGFKYLSTNKDVEDELAKLVRLVNGIDSGKYLRIVHKATQRISYLSKVDFKLKYKSKYEILRDFFDPKNGVTLHGYWAEKRLADTLPLNFLEFGNYSKKRVRGKKK